MTRPAPKNISVTPVFQAAWSQFFPFHGEQRKGCQFGSERALIGDGKNCWLAVSGAWSGVRAVIRGPALGARTLPGISSAARADTGPAAAWPVSYEASWAEKTAKNRLKSVGF